MKSEFITLLQEMSGNTSINEKDYCTIEHVYTYHPAIKDKKHIVTLYLDFGMSVINDMVERADKVALLEDKIRIVELDLESLRNELSDLRD